MAGLWQGSDPVSQPNENAYSPQVAVDSNGNVWAIWSQASGIKARLYSGSSWSSIVTISTAMGSDPHIACGGDGTFIAIWIQAGRVWCSLYKQGAGWQQAEAIDSELDSGTVSEPRIVMDSQGRAVAVWIEGGNVCSSRFE